MHANKLTLVSLCTRSVLSIPELGGVFLQKNIQFPQFPIFDVSFTSVENFAVQTGPYIDLRQVVGLQQICIQEHDAI